MTHKQRLENESRTILLKNHIKPDTELLIVIKSVSASGMCRRMRVLVNNYDISHHIANLCDLSLNEKGLRVYGCGMNMAFWLADHITHSLWPNKATRPTLSGNGGGCLNWQTV